MNLFQIKPFLDSLATTITQIVQLDLTIFDNRYIRVAVSGGHYKQVEAPPPEVDSATRRVLQTGKPFFSQDIPRDFPGLVQRPEKAALLHPIYFNNEIIGVLGLIAFNEKQRKALIHDLESFRRFLDELCKIVTAKLREEQVAAENIAVTQQISAILSDFDWGVQLIDENMVVLRANQMAADILHMPLKQVEGMTLTNPALLEMLYQVFHFNVSTEQVIMCQSGEEVLTRGKPLILEKAKYALLYMEKTSSLRNKILLIDRQVPVMTADAYLGESLPVTQIRKKMIQAAPNDSTILITGESGTGKELAAMIIHSLSQRRNKPFVNVNCGGDSIEAELFGLPGHSNPQGKLFQANGGTLFLDEISELPLSVQAKLFRILQEGQSGYSVDRARSDFDVRIIVSSSKNLYELVQEGKFSKNLFYQISVIPLELPPLRERKQDIIVLLHHFMKQFSNKFSKIINGIEPTALEFIMGYDWPGNVRELQNAVEYMINFENSDVLTVNCLPNKLMPATCRFSHQSTLKEELQQYEDQILLEVLSQYSLPLNEENVLNICTRLGLSRASFYRKYRSLRMRKTIR